MSFAKVTLSGVLTTDPEKRFTPNNNAVSSFNIAVDNPANNARSGGSNEPFTVKVTCWRNLADVVTEQLHKEDAVLVDGKLIINSFQTPEGVQKKLFEVEASTLHRLAGKPEPITPVATGNGSGEGAPQGGGAKQRANYGAEGNQSTATMDYPQQPQPVRAGANASPNHFSSEDLLTEDDIPF